MNLDTVEEYVKWVCEVNLNQGKTKLIEIHPGVDVNKTYKVVFETDVIVFVKLLVRRPLDKAERFRFSKVAHILKRLKLETGIPIPNIRLLSEKKIHLNDTTIYSTLIFDEISGIPLKTAWKQMNSQEQVWIAESMANFTRQIHSVKFKSFGDLGSREDFGKDSWQEFLLDICTSVQNKFHNKSETKISLEVVDNAISFIRKSLTRMDEIPEASLIHNDLWGANIIVNKTDSGWQIKGLLDWEWAISGDPDYELCFLDQELFENQKEAIEKFYTTYGIDSTSPEFKEKKRLYTIIQCLSTLGIGFHYHNPTVEGFAQNEKIIVENLPQ